MIKSNYFVLVVHFTIYLHCMGCSSLNNHNSHTHGGCVGSEVFDQYQFDISVKEITWLDKHWLVTLLVKNENDYPVIIDPSFHQLVIQYGFNDKDSESILLYQIERPPAVGSYDLIYMLRERPGKPSTILIEVPCHAIVVPSRDRFLGGRSDHVISIDMIEDVKVSFSVHLINQPDVFAKSYKLIQWREDGGPSQKEQP